MIRDVPLELRSARAAFFSFSHGGRSFGRAWWPFTVAVLGALLSACSSKSSHHPSEPLQPALWTTDDGSGVSFTLEEHEGELSGIAWLQDPESGEWLYNGKLSGTHTGASLTWTVGIVTVRAHQEGNQIKGTVSYAASDGEPEQTFAIALARTAQ